SPVNCLWKKPLKPVSAVLLGAVMLALQHGAAEASDFYAIVANLTGAKHPEAHLDVSGDSVTTRPGTGIVFLVLDMNGIQLAEFTVPGRVVTLSPLTSRCA